MKRLSQIDLSREQSEAVIVGPDDAAWALDRNGNNRNMTRSVWNRYAAAMAAGKWLDIKFLMLSLPTSLSSMKELRPMTVDSYRGHPNKVKCPLKNIAPTEKLAMQARVWARHKMINGRLKNWGILSQVFWHDIPRHGEVFWACALLTQLTIEQDEPLFSVEYED